MEGSTALRDARMLSAQYFKNSLLDKTYLLVYNRPAFHKRTIWLKNVR